MFVFHEETGVSVNPPKSSCYAQNKQTLQTLSQTIFQFSYVFQQSITQNNFFRGTIYPCFEKFFQGDNLLIFSYGVTNSGKTYTMQGEAIYNLILLLFELVYFTNWFVFRHQLRSGTHTSHTRLFI